MTEEHKVVVDRNIDATMHANEFQQLARCPFCGGEAELAGDDEMRWTQICCKSCGCRSHERPDGDLQKLIASWNRRESGNWEYRVVYDSLKPLPGVELKPTPIDLPEMFATVLFEKTMVGFHIERRQAAGEWQDWPNMKFGPTPDNFDPVPVKDF